jgi:hypothetical protein
MKNIDLNIEGLRNCKIDEAYGQYGKYTAKVTRFISNLIDYLNEYDFSTGNGICFHISVTSKDLRIDKSDSIRDIYDIVLLYKNIGV